jgi:hypothetical protein
MNKKYGFIKDVELRKVKRALGRLRDQEQAGLEVAAEREELIKKLLYIKHYPEDRKYISLFPPSELTPKAKELQQQTMQEVLSTRQRILSKRAPAPAPEPRKDDFFLDEN